MQLPPPTTLLVLLAAAMKRVPPDESDGIARVVVRGADDAKTGRTLHIKQESDDDGNRTLLVELVPDDQAKAIIQREIDEAPSGATITRQMGDSGSGSVTIEETGPTVGGVSLEDAVREVVLNRGGLASLMSSGTFDDLEEFHEFLHALHDVIIGPHVPDQAAARPRVH